MFSSDVTNYSTPQTLFDIIDSEMHFTLDVCADKSNHKCKRYFNEKIDGLSQSWAGETCFCNPPYGREQIKWIQKSYTESCNDDTVVVMLIPSRTDTRVYHEVIAPYATEIRFLKGRIKFSGNKNAAPFPSAIVVFGTFPYMGQQVKWVDYK